VYSDCLLLYVPCCPCINFLTLSRYGADPYALQTSDDDGNMELMLGPEMCQPTHVSKKVRGSALSPRITGCEPRC